MIREIKHRLRGEPKVFPVEPVHRSGTLIVVRFVSDRAFQVDGVLFASGCVTLGYFWSDRAYNVYRLAGPDGALIAHRFDILRDVRVAEETVEWTDLLVDAWAWPDGRLEWKDEDQLAEYRTRGWMSAADEAHVRATRAHLQSTMPAILAEVESLAAGLQA